MAVRIYRKIFQRPVAGESPTVPAKPEQPEFFDMPTVAKKATACSADPTEAVSHLADVTDRMHGLLMDRADDLMGCTESSPEEAEPEALTDVIEAYEHRRWPDGKIPGGKG